LTNKHTYTRNSVKYSYVDLTGHPTLVGEELVHSLHGVTLLETPDVAQPSRRLGGWRRALSTSSLRLYFATRTSRRRLANARHTACQCYTSGITVYSSRHWSLQCGWIKQMTGGHKERRVRDYELTSWRRGQSPCSPARLIFTPGEGKGVGGLPYLPCLQLWLWSLKV